MTTTSLRLRNPQPYWIAAASFLIAMLVFSALIPVCVDTYKQLRGSLFTGLFAVAGFLISAKSLVILNMRKEVYGDPRYLKMIHDNHWADVDVQSKHGKVTRGECGPLPNVYLPLSRIGTLLTINIVIALVSSLSQITFGLTDKSFAVVFCLSAAFGTASLLICSVILMGQNFKSLYAFWEKNAQTDLEETWKKEMEKFHADAPHAESVDLPIQPTKKVGEKNEQDGGGGGVQ